MFYTYTFFGFITQVKLVVGCITDRSTATFVAVVSTSVCRGVRIVASSLC
jgi:hypothetical protein